MSDRKQTMIRNHSTQCNIELSICLLGPNFSRALPRTFQPAVHHCRPNNHHSNQRPNTTWIAFVSSGLICLQRSAKLASFSTGTGCCRQCLSVDTRSHARSSKVTAQSAGGVVNTDGLCLCRSRLVVKFQTS